MQNMELNNEEERRHYAQRIRKQKEALENLLEIASQHRRLFNSDILRQLHEREEECQRLCRKLEKNEFEIAIVGLEKAGKSTFANALMKNKILPDADERCTYTSTCIRYGQDKARVKFFTQSEFDQKLRDKLHAMGIENVGQYSIATLTRGEYQRLYGKLSAREQAAYENYENKDVENILENREGLLNRFLDQEDKVFQGEQLQSDEFRQYIVSKGVAIAVKEVSIESSRMEKMQNAIIYDVPGFDSPTKMHAEQTEERMKKADVIILIASAEKPNFTAPSLDMFNKVVDEDNVELSEKLFVFGNRADAANTLRKNIETLKEEVQKYKLLRDVHIGDRLLIGSAKAHLQKLGQEKGDFCIRKLEEEECKKILVYGDGIDHVYEKLVEYNASDRFRILKRKVNENDQEIQKIFEQLRTEYGKSEYSIGDAKRLMARNNEICSRSRQKLIEGLEKLRSSVRDKYRSDALLSKKMQEAIDLLFGDGRYTITEDEIAIAKRKIDGIGTTYVEKVEEYIRQDKFYAIYQEFSDTVLKIAREDHKQYFDQIIELFEDALEISPSGADYDKLKAQIIEYVQVYKKREEPDDSYQALIERFVRDLVEILIRRPYGMEARLNRFLDDVSSFSGLVMFYDSGSNMVNYKRASMAVAPKDQPQLYALLFHEYKDALRVSKSVLDYIGSISKEICNSAPALQLIYGIIKKNPVVAIDAIRQALTKQDFKMYKEDRDIVKELIPKLRTVFNDIPLEQKNGRPVDMGGYDFTNKDSFIAQYKRHFGDIGELRSYDDVMADYKEDLEILKDFLLSASIPAISIEKPFIAKEVKAIDGLIKCIRSDNYSEFITQNFELLCKESVVEFERLQSEKLVNKEVVRQIESVLNTMAAAG